MSAPAPLSDKMISSPAIEARAVQWGCFLAAPATLWLGFSKTARVASTEAEALGLTIACLSLALLIVMLGVIAPIAWKKRTA